MFDLAPTTTVERLLVLARCHIARHLTLRDIGVESFQPRAGDMQKTVQECGLRSGRRRNIHDGTED